MARYCSNCGRELPDEATYCPECGKRFIPRYKADNSDCNDYSDKGTISDYEFHGPFGQSSKKFEGPFGPHSNRGSNELSSNSNSSSSSSLNSTDSSSSSGFPDPSNSPSSHSSLSFKGFDFKMLCVIIFIALLIIAGIFYFICFDDSSDVDSSVFIGNAKSLNSKNSTYDYHNFQSKGSLASDESYNISIGRGAYLNGKGEAQLIDLNHSYNLVSDEFNITEYETYYINVDGEDWYVLNIFKCRFDAPAKSMVYTTDMDDGDPIIIYSAKGDYYGYGIIMPNASDNSTYKNREFLESIFILE